MLALGSCSGSPSGTSGARRTIAVRSGSPAPSGSHKKNQTMTQTRTYPLRLPRSLKEAVKRLSRVDGTSMNQSVATAVAEKVSALQTTRFFADRRARADLIETLCIKNATISAKRGVDLTGGHNRGVAAKTFGCVDDVLHESVEVLGAAVGQVVLGWPRSKRPRQDSAAGRRRGNAPGADAGVGGGVDPAVRLYGLGNCPEARSPGRASVAADAGGRRTPPLAGCCRTQAGNRGRGVGVGD